MQFEFSFADSKPDPNVCNVSLITHWHISKLQILSPEFKYTHTLQYIHATFLCQKQCIERFSV